MATFLRLAVLAVMGLMLVGGGPLPCATGQTQETPAEKAAKQLKLALGIKPKQAALDEIDVPAEADQATCRIESAAKSLKLPGWIVRDATGRTLRVFLDTDKDNALDQWSFYRNGMEVYRDIDTTKNNKPDQHRWMGTAGIRWGVDANEDGKIEAWKMISGDEVATEAFLAVREGDAARFAALLLTADELAGLKLGTEMAATASDRLTQASADFPSFARSQSSIKPDSKFVHFGSQRPCLIPAGPDVGAQDLIFYDRGSAVFENGDELAQLDLGTMIRVGEAWRLVELPAVADATNTVANGGLFFNLPGVGESDVAAANPAGGALSELFAKWEELDGKLKDAKAGAETEKLQRERAIVFQDLILGSQTDDDRRNWTRQMTDTVTSAFQGGVFDGGLEVLSEVSTRLKKESVTSDLDYIAWRSLSARYTRELQADEDDRSSATERFMKDLEGFIGDWPKSEFTPEALMQLALYTEVNSAGDPEAAGALYARVVKDFPDSPLASRARGAQLRLTVAGKTLPFKGKAIGGQEFDLQDPRWRGKAVVLFFWVKWSPTCGDDFKELQRLAAKYKDDLMVVGVNLDEKREDATAFLKQNPNANWPNLYEDGGLEGSPLATQLGITAPPMVVLVDKDGKGVDATLAVAELDREIQRLNRRGE
jgi:thiol-disulfide isomerase/thioredoxin